MDKILKILLAIILSLFIVVFIGRICLGFYAYNKIQVETKHSVERFDSVTHSK